MARSLFCYWAVRELEMSNTEVGKKLGISQQAVGYAAGRKEALITLTRAEGLQWDRDGLP
jgi:predicted transcriptional regulator